MTLGGHGPLVSRRALGRELTRVANASVTDVLKEIGDTKNLPATRRIGFTGPPGAGKSTLISALAAHRLLQCGTGTIAVLAIDPTSPITGGSILGDRIRMDAIAELPGLFIRSVASRSAHNGLCENAIDLLVTLERHGFEEVFLETVGVGQAEIDVSNLVDTTVVLVPPDAGDAIQIMKSGILEVADVYVVTKSENPGAQRMASEIASVVGASQRSRSAHPPGVIMTKADGTGIEQLSAEIDRHLGQLRATLSPDQVREQRRRYHLKSLLDRTITEIMRSGISFSDTTLRDAYAALLEELFRSHPDTYISDRRRHC